jgi:hypothetical protein
MNPFATIDPAAPDLATTLFPQTSRYYGSEIHRMTLADGRQVAYLGRRFVPPRDRFDLVQEHAVAEGDRADNLAAQYLGDAEQFWRLADANFDMNPFDLTAIPNRRLRITLPEGVPAPPPIT